MKALGTPSDDDTVSCEEENTAVGAFDEAAGLLRSEWSTPHPRPRRHRHPAVNGCERVHRSIEAADDIDEKITQFSRCSMQ